MTAKTLSWLPLLLLITSCATSFPPLPTVENVDLKRYMGPWYVIACIPTFIETKAYNAIDSDQVEESAAALAGGKMMTTQGGWGVGAQRDGSFWLFGSTNPKGGKP